MKEMSLEEAKKRLTTIITTKFNNDYSIDSVDKEAIEKVLNELDKRISVEKLEKELDELQVPILCWGGRGNGKSYARAVKEAKKYLLKKLLNKE